MGLFDDYFDPDQFQDSGGLYGRLLSVRPDLAFQSSSGADAPNSFDGSALPAPQTSFSPAAAQPALDATQASSAGAASAPDPTQNSLSSANLQSSPSADANVSQAPSTFDFGAHLNAAFQKWAQTPVGNPFAALANGITGFNTVQPTDTSFIGPPAPPPAQMPDFGDRLGAALQSWAQTPAGSPFAGLANGINGFNTGQMSVAPAATTAQTQDPDDRSSAPAQRAPTAPAANPNAQMLLRRPPGLRKWPR
ncbi:hypothetical protein [Bradyrhizobium sp.]|uniref:hypothetical protein n=1 Tax=Bradyrhizobium sp. TaxID=376 RepID=UPI002611508C|nr:hypothetical protein [Bradyrhizobium sp.]